MWRMPLPLNVWIETTVLRPRSPKLVQPDAATIVPNKVDGL